MVGCKQKTAYELRISDWSSDVSSSELLHPAMSEPGEGARGVGRVEAFSDGVVAIIITIMVLALHPPVAHEFGRLWTLWPAFLAYVLSYAYVAIYWVNHHRLRSEEHTSELQSLMRIPYAFSCLIK